MADSKIDDSVLEERCAAIGSAFIEYGEARKKFEANKAAFSSAEADLSDVEKTEEEHLETLMKNLVVEYWKAEAESKKLVGKLRSKRDKCESELDDSVYRLEKAEDEVYNTRNEYFNRLVELTNKTIELTKVELSADVMAFEGKDVDETVNLLRDDLNKRGLLECDLKIKLPESTPDAVARAVETAEVTYVAGCVKIKSSVENSGSVPVIDARNLKRKQAPVGTVVSEKPVGPNPEPIEDIVVPSRLVGAGAEIVGGQADDAEIHTSDLGSIVKYRGIGKQKDMFEYWDNQGGGMVMMAVPDFYNLGKALLNKDDFVRKIVEQFRKSCIPLVLTSTILSKGNSPKEGNIIHYSGGNSPFEIGVSGVNMPWYSNLEDFSNEFVLDSFLAKDWGLSGDVCLKCMQALCQTNDSGEDIKRTWRALALPKKNVMVRIPGWDVWDQNIESVIAFYCSGDDFFIGCYLLNDRGNSYGIKKI